MRRISGLATAGAAAAAQWRLRSFRASASCELPGWTQAPCGLGLPLRPPLVLRVARGNLARVLDCRGGRSGWSGGGDVDLQHVKRGRFHDLLEDSTVATAAHDAHAKACARAGAKTSPSGGGGGRRTILLDPALPRRLQLVAPAALCDQGNRYRVSGSDTGASVVRSLRRGGGPHALKRRKRDAAPGAGEEGGTGQDAQR